MNEDKDKLGKIIDNVMNLSGIQISNQFRLGRYEANGAKLRPVKFTVGSMDDKRLTLDILESVQMSGTALWRRQRACSLIAI